MHPIPIFVKIILLIFSDDHNPALPAFAAHRIVFYYL
jgi:hypothetical protein